GSDSGWEAGVEILGISAALIGAAHTCAHATIEKSGLASTADGTSPDAGILGQGVDRQLNETENRVLPFWTATERTNPDSLGGGPCGRHRLHSLEQWQASAMEPEQIGAKRPRPK